MLIRTAVLQEARRWPAASSLGHRAREGSRSELPRQSNRGSELKEGHSLRG